MAVLESNDRPNVEQIAYDIWSKRGRLPSDGRDEWLEAEKTVLINERIRVQQKAGDLWIGRGKPYGDSLLDWVVAERLIIWEEWARAKLRPYLAIGAVRQPQVLDSSSKHRSATGSFLEAGIVSIISVLDGSPEFSRHCYQSAKENGIRPEARVHSRDDEFQRSGWTVFRKFGGRFVDRGDDTAKATAERRYQDGCLVEFDGPSPRRAIEAALILRESLTQCNELENRSWMERLHARTVIGGGFRDAARYLENTQRDQIIVSRKVFDRLTDGERELLEAANVSSSLG